MIMGLSEEYYLYWYEASWELMRLFGEAQSKAMKAYAQSGQYHTIVKSRDS